MSPLASSTSSSTFTSTSGSSGPHTETASPQKCPRSTSYMNHYLSSHLYPHIHRIYQLSTSACVSLLSAALIVDRPFKRSPLLLGSGVRAPGSLKNEGVTDYEQLTCSIVLAVEQCCKGMKRVLGLYRQAAVVGDRSESRSRMACFTWPLATDTQTGIVVSNSGHYVAHFTTEPTKSASQCVSELRQEGDNAQRNDREGKVNRIEVMDRESGCIILCMEVSTDIHGKVWPMGKYGGAEFNTLDTRLLYVAEVAESDNNGNELSKYNWKDDWGEQMKGLRCGRACIADITTGCVIAVQPPVELSSCGQLSWMPDAKSFLCTVWDTQPHRLGLVYCQNRPCKVYIVSPHTCTTSECTESSNVTNLHGTCPKCENNTEDLKWDWEVISAPHDFAAWNAVVVGGVGVDEGLHVRVAYMSVSQEDLSHMPHMGETHLTVVQLRQDNNGSYRLHARSRLPLREASQQRLAGCADVIPTGKLLDTTTLEREGDGLCAKLCAERLGRKCRFTRLSGRLCGAELGKWNRYSDGRLLFTNTFIGPAERAVAIDTVTGQMIVISPDRSICCTETLTIVALKSPFILLQHSNPVCKPRILVCTFQADFSDDNPEIIDCHITVSLVDTIALARCQYLGVIPTAEQAKRSPSSCCPPIRYVMPRASTASVTGSSVWDCSAIGHLDKALKGLEWFVWRDRHIVVVGRKDGQAPRRVSGICGWEGKRMDAANSSHMESDYAVKGEGGFRGLVVLLHGGPHAVYSSVFIGQTVFLTLLGYDVLAINYRGSLGFGNIELLSLLGRAGVQDNDDVCKTVEAFLQEFDYDRRRVVVMGGSHGGFLSLHAIGQSPSVFRAASCRNPVTNILSMFGTSDIPDWCFAETLKRDLSPINPYCVGENCGDVLQTMFDRSPLRYVTEVQACVLLAVGLSDRRVPPSQGIEYYKQLNAQGKHCKLLCYPDNDHRIENAGCTEDYFLNTAMWFLSHTLCLECHQ
eukprot:GHVQ01010189.1.p2 GENE.GHVQ01010189.1~~GHVQ01010189.1.p2  ORF type:complete len:976 (+),score=116.60 GHVQ01010189.1:189-3116(+)